MTLLKCAIAPDSLPRIHELLLCLSKFGETVGIEARPEKLTFTALNASRTAYAAFALDAQTFFLNYDFDATRTGQGRFTCQIGNRTLLSAFRSRLAENKNADTPVERCELSVHEDKDAAECRLEVAIVCRHGLAKIHRLTYESVEIMHALFDKTAAASGWAISSRILREYIEYFGPRTEQLDMLAKDGKVIFTSFTDKIVDGTEVLKQPLETAVSIHVQDFDSFDFQEDVHIVISVKDFKAIVTHAETIKAPISASFSRPSRPLQFSYDVTGIHCEFTLMTTGDYRAGTEPPTPRPVATSAPSRQTTIPAASARRAADMPPPAKPAPIASQIQQRPLAAIKRGMQLGSQQTPNRDPDSLFVPDDRDDDSRWDPAEDADPDAGDLLGWDASGQQSYDRGFTLRDAGSYATQPRPSAGPEAESTGLAATQRLSQMHGLFD